MRVGTVCSGIGAPEYAWRALGFDAVFASEIDPFAKEVFAFWHPLIKLYGDMTDGQIKKEQKGKIDLLCGGTPCQSFSVAGNRKGVEDDRGNLAVEFCRLGKHLGAKWLLWENVQGCLTNGFGSVVATATGREELAEIRKWPNAGFADGRDGWYSVAWRILDSRFFGVPQRRRRVFLVRCTGKSGLAASTGVLFEPESGSGDTGQSEEGESETAKGVDGCAEGNGRVINGARLNGVYASDLPSTLDTDGKSIVILASAQANAEIGVGVSLALMARQYKGAPIIMAGDNSKAGVGVGVAPALLASQSHNTVALNDGVLRYMTPLEGERCFGLPDNYTNIDGATKSKRYRVQGNSMAVPVLTWLGIRIKAVNSLLS